MGPSASLTATPRKAPTTAEPRSSALRVAATVPAKTVTFTGSWLLLGVPHSYDNVALLVHSDWPASSKS